MPDDQQLPTLPPDTQASWLSRNQKLVILGGLAVVLVVAAVLTAWLPRRTAKQNTSTQQTTNTSTTTNASATNRPTFQRAVVTNTSTTLPSTYRPPTIDDLKQAITKLDNSTTKP